MSQFIEIHPDNPQLYLLSEAASIVKRGGVIVYPTDSSYAMGCRLDDKRATDRIKRLRQLDDSHHFTLICRDLSELSTYAKVNNQVFRLLRAFTPGPYTFILPATKEAPRRLQNPKRKTIGLRIPDHPITQALLEALEQPMLSTSLILPGHELPLVEPEAMRDILGKQVDLIIDGGYCGVEKTSMIDLTGPEPVILRYGLGDLSTFE